jgi:hypothetical protein
MRRRSSKREPLPRGESDGAVAAPDLEALLCALVLVPDAYSRNRFFRLYQEPEVQRLRRRAARLRSLIRDLVAAGAREGSCSETRTRDGRATFVFELPELNARRRAMLDALEASVVHYALARATEGECEAGDRARVEACLARLAAFRAPPDT